MKLYNNFSASPVDLVQLEGPDSTVGTDLRVTRVMRAGTDCQVGLY